MHQLLHQFPTAFQFNNRLLLFLAHEVYSCKYGTFLYNCEFEREFYSIRSKSESIWTYVNDNFRQFLNPFFWSDEHFSESQVLEPCTEFMAIRFWKEHFYQFSPDHFEYNLHSDAQSAEEHCEILALEELDS